MSISNIHIIRNISYVFGFRVYLYAGRVSFDRNHLNQSDKVLIIFLKYYELQNIDNFWPFTSKSTTLTFYIYETTHKIEISLKKKKGVCI